MASQTSLITVTTGMITSYPNEIHMKDNPYSSTTTDAFGDAAMRSPKSSPFTSLGLIAKPTFRAWERLRIVFLILLGMLTILLAGPNITRFRTLVLIAEGTIVANVCYFAGPLVETYVRWLGYNSQWLRWFLFIGGTLLIAVFAVATMASIFLPDQN